MLTTSQLRDILHLPRNTKSRQVWNAAIRRTAGGGELLDLLERLDYLRVQTPGNAHVAAEVGKLRQQRADLANAIRDGRIEVKH